MLHADYRLYVNRDLPIEERECTSKAAYSTRREARCMMRRGHHAAGQLEPYHCSFCDLWHLGHPRCAHRR